MSEPYIGTREQLIGSMKKEMAAFAEHNDHVVYHKDEMMRLHDVFPHDSIILKCDFIQNILHGRGRETSQSYYNKRQTQFLSCVVWYWQRTSSGTWEKHKLYVDYLSSYLAHNSLFFQKCIRHLLAHLRDDIGLKFRKVSSTALSYRGGGGGEG